MFRTLIVLPIGSAALSAVAPSDGARASLLSPLNSENVASTMAYMQGMFKKSMTSQTRLVDLPVEAITGTFRNTSLGYDGKQPQGYVASDRLMRQMPYLPDLPMAKIMNEALSNAHFYKLRDDPAVSNYPHLTDGQRGSHAFLKLAIATHF